MKHKLLVSIKALSIKKATPRSINLVMAKCLYARGAYAGMSVRRLTQSSPPNFVGAPKTFEPPKQRTSINRFGREVMASNGSPLWSNNVSATASAAF